MSMKESTIDLLRIAECNLLYSFKDIKPDEVNTRIHPEFNTIGWILGHCFSHFHMVLCSTLQEINLLDDNVSHYFRYGTTKKEIERDGLSMTFEELIDKYLEISTSGFSHLEQLHDSDFTRMIFPMSEETIERSIQRVSLHFLGHVGQIQSIKKELGKGGYFVTGIKKKQRVDSREKWLKWWNENKETYS